MPLHVLIRRVSCTGRLQLAFEEMESKEMKKLLLAIILGASLFAQTGYIGVHTIADITGDGATHQLFSGGGSCRWVQVVAPSTNSAAVRIGDSAISATQGLTVAAGNGQMLPPLTVDPRESIAGLHLYDMSQLYYRAASGDKLSVIWAN